MRYIATFSSHTAAQHACQALSGRVSSGRVSIVRRRNEDISHGVILGGGLGGLLLLSTSTPPGLPGIHLRWMMGLGPFLSLLLGVAAGGVVGAWFDRRSGRGADRSLFGPLPGRAALLFEGEDDSLLGLLKTQSALAIAPAPPDGEGR